MEGGVPAVLHHSLVIPRPRQRLPPTRPCGSSWSGLLQVGRFCGTLPPRAKHTADSRRGGVALPQQYNIILIYVILFALLYFLLIRPQQVQRRRRQEMLSKLKKGDRVVTLGGFHATIVDLKDEVLTLEIAPNVRVKADRSAVSYVRSKQEKDDG